MFYLKENIHILGECSGPLTVPHSCMPQVHFTMDVGGERLTGALHVILLQLLPPLPSSLAPLKPVNQGSPG